MYIKKSEAEILKSLHTILQHERNTGENVFILKRADFVYCVNLLAHQSLVIL